MYVCVYVIWNVLNVENYKNYIEIYIFLLNYF